MSEETREFIRLRSDLYAAERSKCPPEVTVDPDVDEDACDGCEGRGEVKIYRAGKLMDEVTCPKCGGRGV